MSTITFRSLHKQDINNFAGLCQKTWQETYGEVFGINDLEILFGQHYRTLQLITEMQMDNIEYLVAIKNNQLIGYMKLIYVDSQVVFLDKLYVLIAYKGQGCGKQLVKIAIQSAEQRQCKIMRLTVWENNTLAIAFYEKKYGFKRTKKVTVKFGNQVFQDYLLEANLEQLLSGSYLNCVV